MGRVDRARSASNWHFISLSYLSLSLSSLSLSLPRFYILSSCSDEGSAGVENYMVDGEGRSSEECLELAVHISFSTLPLSFLSLSLSHSLRLALQLQRRGTRWR